MTGTLYLVATPIGNLEDMTARALRVLREVDVIACEDTRHTRVLLNHYGIKAKTLSYHEHNERERSAELGRRLTEGASIALVSDAGTPVISDPGLRLVREAASLGASIVPVPGATAFVAALIASGLPTDQFFFGGFLPARSTQRRARYEEVRGIPATLIFYEAPHRIAQSLQDAREILGEREAAVARELTKLHEEFARGMLSDLAVRFASSDNARGEFVIVIDRKTVESETTLGDSTLDIALRVVALESEGLETRAALKKVARELGISRSEAYRRLTASRTRAKI
jgi:16S rRNA (cytidine1402-2'-O)-methyltransferase